MEGTITWGPRLFACAFINSFAPPRPYIFIPAVRSLDRSSSQPPFHHFTPHRDVFNILQYRSGPQWVKLASPDHLRAYGNICKNSKSNWTRLGREEEGKGGKGGDVARCIALWDIARKNRTVAPCQLACFTQRYIRHEPCIFTFFLALHWPNTISNQNATP